MSPSRSPTVVILAKGSVSGARPGAPSRSTERSSTCDRKSAIEASARANGAAVQRWLGRPAGQAHGGPGAVVRLQGWTAELGERFSEAPKTKPPERGLVRLRSHRIGAGQGVSAGAAYPAPLVEMPLALRDWMVAEGSTGTVDHRSFSRVKRSANEPPRFRARGGWTCLRAV